MEWFKVHSFLEANGNFPVKGDVDCSFDNALKSFVDFSDCEHAVMVWRDWGNEASLVVAGTGGVTDLIGMNIEAFERVSLDCLI